MTPSTRIHRRVVSIRRAMPCLPAAKPALRSSEIVRSVDGHSIVIDQHHPDTDAVFDESEHLHALGLLHRTGRQASERVQAFAGEAVKTKLPKIGRARGPWVRNGLPGEHQRLTVGPERHLDDVVVDDCGRLADWRVGVDGQNVRILLTYQGRDHGVDGAWRDKGFVALDIDVSVRIDPPRTFSDSIGARGMTSGHHRLYFELLADLHDSVVIGGHHHLIDKSRAQALVVDVPHERPALQERKRLSRKPAGSIAARDDGDMPSSVHKMNVKQVPRKYKPYRLILFDLDGVLMDTREIMRIAWRQVQEVHGIVASFDEYSSHLGRPFPDIIGRLGIAYGDEILATYERASTRVAHLAKPFPGILPSLRILTDAGCRLGVVTSKPRQRAVPLVEMLGASFVTVRTPEAVRGKPAPDPLMLAMVDAGVDPADTIYVGDMAVDQQAARRAGVAYAHAAWGYGHPDEPCPRVLRAPSDLTELGGVGGGGEPR